MYLHLVDIGTVLGSAGAFKLVNATVGRLPIPRAVAKKDPWRWRNISTSLIHSTLTGAWAVLSFYQHPEMAEDLISTHSAFSHTLVSVSTGYFVYDFMDMVLNQTFSANWELLLHHTVVISCFGIAVLRWQFVGFAVVALLVELNSVFLHLRQLLRMSGAATRGALYRLNSALTLGSFLAFRFSTLGFMARWLLLQRGRISTPFYVTGGTGLAAVMVMNLVLFYRLVDSDYIRAGRERGRKENGPE